MTKTFDPTKPVQTRDGRKARIICTDRRIKGCKPIVALVSYGDGDEYCVSFCGDGHFFEHRESLGDLINAPEVTKKYQRLFFSHRTFETLLSDQEHDSLERARTGGGLGLKYLGVIESTLTDGVVTSVALLPWED